MKGSNIRKLFLEELGKTGIIQQACEKVGISRQTIHRWAKLEPEFREEMKEAIYDGDSRTNDMTVSKLLTKIKDGDMQAIRFQLDRRSPKYSKMSLNNEFIQEKQRLIEIIKRQEERIKLNEKLQSGDPDVYVNLDILIELEEDTLRYIQAMQQVMRKEGNKPIKIRDLMAKTRVKSKMLYDKKL
jgi:hypothetical protein